jgi:hypothetical protein
MGPQDVFSLVIDNQWKNLSIFIGFNGGIFYLSICLPFISFGICCKKVKDNDWFCFDDNR